MRAVIRVVAVGISGALGFAVMWKLDVATNPYGLTAILVAWAGLLGAPSFSPMHHKVRRPCPAIVQQDAASLCLHGT